MNISQGGESKFSQNYHLVPKEQLYDTGIGKTKLRISLLKETIYEENRVALVPQAVGLLVQNGHEVLVEQGAGEKAHFPDIKYSELGAIIINNREELFKSNIILKVAPLSSDEILLLNSGQIIFSALQTSIQNHEYFRNLQAKRVTALAYEHIMDKTGTYPMVRSISEIAGNTAILIAAEYISNHHYGKGLMLGGISGITPTEIVIIGAGTVGEFAARAAIGLGALVKVFDNSVYKLRRLSNNLNERIYSSIIQPKVMAEALRTADVVIGAVHTTESRTPIIVSEEMVSHMKFGSVIIDVSIDQGGCFETSRTTTHANPVFTKYNVTHYCVPNISSRVPHTASYAISNFIAPILLKISEKPSLESLINQDYGIRKGVYFYKGILCSKTIGDLFNMPYQDIDLLMAAFH